MPVTAAQLLQMASSFDWARWSAQYGQILDQHERNVVKLAGKASNSAFDMNDPFTSSFMTSYVGERITSLEKTTKDKVADLLRRTIDEATELTTFEIGTAVHDAVVEQFGGFARYRADTIARTETAIAYNHGNVLGLSQAGVGQVVVSDGDDDEDCAKVNGAIWTIQQALDEPVAHPNCSRAFSAYLED